MHTILQSFTRILLNLIAPQPVAAPRPVRISMRISDRHRPMGRTQDRWH